MRLSTALANISLLGIETAPFIYYVEQNPMYRARVDDIFHRVDAGLVELITSTITLTEVLVMPIQSGNAIYEHEYRDMLLNTAHITAIPVSAKIAERAAHLRAKYRLRTPDAIHVATAIESQCDAFVTNDLGLKRITELRILILDDLET